ncbi:MAG: hypothetical protein OXU69_07335 [Gemmatimonadota bacterium]|nr:hypothetical protein [Gemmatimonadota bacterium]MDE2984504.1 hypothetical protein [Gemmatimonadota bacterium]
MFFYVLAGWTAMTLISLPWLTRKLPEQQRAGIFVFSAVELVLCFVGLIVLWRTGWGGAVTDTTFAWVFALLLVGAGTVYMVLRDAD